MADFSFNEHTHRRYNPLTGKWILVSPHRAKRPWQGQTEDIKKEKRLEHDPNCYLCPGNTRVNSAKNPDYKDVYVFDNDFQALINDIPEGNVQENGFIKAKSEKGLCRVICFSPRHDLTIPDMNVEDIEKVVEIWCEQYEEIGSLPYINYIQIFENKGSAMGCSNPHPHGQIWANESIPQESTEEIFHLKKWKEDNGTCLLCEYAEYEKKVKTRIVCENDNFTAIVPFWAVWPFETMILSLSHLRSLKDFQAEHKKDLASIFKELTSIYDRLFNVSFPYSMGIHQAPTDGSEYNECHLHLHFYPPLLRSATVKKFMVGYELLAEPQRDITAEISAERLRALK